MKRIYEPNNSKKKSLYNYINIRRRKKNFKFKDVIRDKGE